MLNVTTYSIEQCCSLAFSFLYKLGYFIFLSILQRIINKVSFGRYSKLFQFNFMYEIHMSRSFITTICLCCLCKLYSKDFLKILILIRNIIIMDELSVLELDLQVELTTFSHEVV